MIATVLLTIGLNVVQVRCTFDNVPMSGNYVGYSATQAGNCHDYGVSLNGWSNQDMRNKIFGCVNGTGSATCLDTLRKRGTEP